MALGGELGGQTGSTNLQVTAGSSCEYTWFAEVTKWFAPNESYTGCKGTLAMRNGNLIVYDWNATRALWSSNTAGNPGSKLVFQSDGNLVIYRANGSVAWASNTGH